MSTEQAENPQPRPAPPAVRELPPRLGEGYGMSARIAAEIAGAFLLFFGALGIGMFNPQGGFAVPFGFGLAVIAGMLAFGHISGGQFNPAITLGSALAGRTSWKNVLPYIIAQLVGTSLAAVVLWVIMRSHPVGSQAAQVFSSVANGYASGEDLGFTMAGVFLAETIGTAMLVAIYLGATSSRDRLRSAPYAVGLAFAVLTAALLPISNAGMNPARSTAAVYFAEPAALGELWLFWAAPVLGAVIAGLLYRSAETVPAAKTKNADDAGRQASAAADTSAAGSVTGTATGTAAGDGVAGGNAVVDTVEDDKNTADGKPVRDDLGAAEARDFFDQKPAPKDAGRKDSAE
ncbi:MIP/aquaporin family protein [Arthrobacter crystallopoietes]|uniref:Aquaporin Z n=1 Tax=Crystallibacter crystallopoietes TaxID=37928 RepID=A0A1H1FPK2_9MICC|nr:aquaporin [Arthrobacter crystallopoietes]SDR02831.1 aquaporin Z [Arthrobacter crystallopoietes]